MTVAVLSNLSVRSQESTSSLLEFEERGLVSFGNLSNVLGKLPGSSTARAKSASCRTKRGQETSGGDMAKHRARQTRKDTGRKA